VRLRKLEESIFKGLMIVSVLSVMAILAVVTIVIIVKGASALSLSMIFETPKGGYYLGKGGGIANAIVGSLYLALGASLIAVVTSVPIAVGLQKEYSNRTLANVTRLILDVLWGTPSIVYGAFGFVVMMYFGLRASLLGGIIVLTLLMIPIMVRSMEGVLRMIPVDLKEVSYALGTTKMETTRSVVLKQAIPGIVTAVFLGFGRGIGDAASVLFTAGYTDYIPRSIFDPVASLPLAIFFQIGTPIPEVQDRAYASALILMVIVLVISVLSRVLSSRFSRNIVR
jgi:phosphate transport system permease protein